MGIVRQGVVRSSSTGSSFWIWRAASKLFAAVMSVNRLFLAACLIFVLAHQAVSLPWPLSSGHDTEASYTGGDEYGTEDPEYHGHKHKREAEESADEETAGDDKMSAEESSSEEAQDRESQKFFGQAAHLNMGSNEYNPAPHHGGNEYNPAPHHGGNEYKTAPSYGANDYNPAPSYGTKQSKKCETYYDYEYSEKCINYNDKVCYTKYQEHCSDVTKDNCKGMIKSEQVRKCTDVTELLCGLAETVQYEMATASFTVQKCHKVKERVCDTVYEPEVKSKDDYQCINVKTYKCTQSEKTMLDKTCRYVTKHNCETYEPKSYGSDYSSGDDSYNAYGESSGYNSNGYGDEYIEPKCTTKQEIKCYETPRTVPTMECKDDYEKVCKKFPEKQACHDEEKKVCELEERQQPKQIEKFVYKKVCKKVPRQLCSSADIKQLVPSCSPATFKTCRYEPKEECEDVPKNFCYKVPKKIKKQRCYNEYETQYGESKPAYPAPSYPAEAKPYSHPVEPEPYNQYPPTPVY